MIMARLPFGSSQGCVFGEQKYSLLHSSAGWDHVRSWRQVLEGELSKLFS